MEIFVLIHCVMSSCFQLPNMDELSIEWQRQVGWNQLEALRNIPHDRINGPAFMLARNVKHDI